MFTKIESLNYKCLRYISQGIGSFHVLVGPNSSGKTTFLDVLKFLGDLITEGPISTVEKRTSNYRTLFWMHEGNSFELAVEAKIPENLRALLDNKNYSTCRYEVRIGSCGNTNELGILRETLWMLLPKNETTTRRQLHLFPQPPSPPQTILLSEKNEAGRKRLINKIFGGNDNFYSETSKWDHSFKLGPQKSALANLPEDEIKFPVSTWFKKNLLEGLQPLTLNSERMRLPSPPGLPKHFRTDGSNLPLVISNLKKQHNKRFKEWIEHVRTALSDIVDIDTVEREEDLHKYITVKYNNNLNVPSWLVSDGTLRMLALTLLAYLPEMRGVYLIEEPENGIHPQAIQTVHQSLSSVYDGQVLVATHSPIFLNISEPKQLLCFAKDKDGAVDIVVGTDHPALREWQKKTSLGDLFASGILN